MIISIHLFAAFVNGQNYVGCVPDLGLSRKGEVMPAIAEQQAT